MEHAPAVNWRLAHRIARLRPDDLPELDARQLTMLVADLRVTARRAGELAARHLGLKAVGATRVSVVDWSGWGHAARTMTEAATTELGLDEPAPGPGTSVSAARNGALLGVGLRVLSRRLLGQYDPFSDTLYLVAPTIVANERRHRFVPADFRLWVAVHEQTHALQFRAAPWLQDHLADRMRTVFHDDVSLTDGLLGWARTGDLSALLTSPEAGGALNELSAAMTFLEGHADHTSDHVTRPHAATVAAMRRAFTRPQRPGLLGRLSATLDKGAQYRDGLEFCRRVQRLKSRYALRAAFAEPGNLPTTAEIASPEQWVTRVHG